MRFFGEKIREFTWSDLEILREIYDCASEMQSFPSICQPVSLMVGKLGYRVMRGKFRVDKPVSTGDLDFYGHSIQTSEIEHFWCEDARHRRLDLTVHQFNPLMSSQVPAGVNIFEPNDEVYARYLYGKKPRLNFLTDWVMVTCFSPESESLGPLLEKLNSRKRL